MFLSEKIKNLLSVGSFCIQCNGFEAAIRPCFFRTSSFNVRNPAPFSPSTVPLLFATSLLCVFFLVKQFTIQVSNN